MDLIFFCYVYHKIFYTIIAIVLILIYVTYVIIDERKKRNKREFFKYTLYYEVDYFLYMDMVKKMKRVLLKKIREKKKILGMNLVSKKG